jgi:RNA recognition motif-containing protein
MNIYVGNLAREVNEDDLRQAFGKFGTVSSVSLIKDKFTGELRGFGFVEMPSKDEAQAAMNALSGKDIKGRSLTVNEARPKTNDGGGRREEGRRSGGYDRGNRRGGDRW